MLKGSWLGGSCLHSCQGRRAGFGSVGGTAALVLALVTFACLDCGGAQGPRCPAAQSTWVWSGNSGNFSTKLLVSQTRA